jgi:hypothetical protein
MFYADRPVTWWPAFESEALRFLKGAHDDQIDALSGATQLAIEAVHRPREEPTQYSIGSPVMSPGASRSSLGPNWTSSSRSNGRMW